MRCSPHSIVALLVLSALALSACSEDEQFARAFRVEDRDQLIGGPGAVADVGDFKLENERVRMHILQPGNSVGPGIFGGGIIDADVQRKRLDLSQAAEGLDQFTELFPTANFIIPDPATLSVEVIDSPEDPDCATIRVEGGGADYLESLFVIGSIANHVEPRVFVTDYTLCPGDNFVRIDTEIQVRVDRETLPDSAPVGELPTLTAPINAFDVFLGNQDKPDGSEPLTGMFAGDFLFFGTKGRLFAPGSGFDPDRGARDRFNLGQSTITAPLEFDVLMSVADRVSYGYMNATPAGATELSKVIIPVFSGSFTAGFTHALDCEDLIEPCEQTRAWRFRRFFIIGDGDAASVLETAYELAGPQLVQTGRVEGVVVDAGDGEPVSGADVFVVRDPRCGDDNGCEAGFVCRPSDGLCVSETNPERDDGDCLADFGVPANARDQFPRSALELLEVNRCTSRTGPQDGGLSGVLSQFRGDATDHPNRTGRFDGALPLGRYFVFARSAERADSKPLPLVMDTTGTKRFSVFADAPALLRYEILDEGGRPIPAKLTLGRGFEECIAVSTGEDCTAPGQTCNGGFCLPAADGTLSCHRQDCPEGQLCDPARRRCYTLPGAGCNEDTPCHGDERCAPAPANNGFTCIPEIEGVLVTELGDSLLAGGIQEILRSSDGEGEQAVRPGIYQVIVSRGPEYTVHREEIELRAREETFLQAQLTRVVDTRGWIAGDFHVHGANSFDANTTHRQQVIAMMAEGVELVSTSDHDYITDLGPTVRELGVERFIKSQVGLETTTLEAGHYIGWPLEFKTSRPENGAIDWTGQSFWPMPRSFLTPQEMMDGLRDLGEFKAEDTVVLVAHPRDGFFGYFDQYGLDQYRLDLTAGLLQGFNPVLAGLNFTNDFDAIEVFNGKRFDLMRTPTVPEIRGFNAAVNALREGPIDDVDALVANERLIAEEYTRNILRRQPEEQFEWLTLIPEGAAACSNDTNCSDNSLPDDAVQRICAQPERVCLLPCDSDAECVGAGENFICDPCRGACVPPGPIPCTAYEGVIDDWFRFLNRGIRKTVIGNSDTHSRNSVEAGLPRTWVRSKTDDPRAISKRAIARSMKAGKTLSSYGPFIDFSAGDAEVGETACVDGSGQIALNLRVQSAPWFDVDRVEIYRNGELLHVLPVEVPNTRVVNVQQTIEDTPGVDAWYAVIAMGLSGKLMSPVYTAMPFPEVGIDDITTRAFAGLTVGGIDLAGLFGPRIPDIFPVYPYALSSAVWVDADCDGTITPVEGAPPAWAAIQESTGQALEIGGPTFEPMDAVPLSSTRIGNPATELVNGHEADRLRYFHYLRAQLARMTRHQHRD